MELLQGITKKNNRTKLYLFIASIILIFLTLFIVAELFLFENKNQLFAKLDEIENKNFNEISLILNENIARELCLKDNKVIACDKISYTQWFGFSNYKLEIVQIEGKLTYSIKNNINSIFHYIIETILFLVFSLVLSYYLLIVYNKFILEIGKSEKEILDKEWEKIKTSKKELEELLSKGENNIKDELDKIRKKYEKLIKEEEALKQKYEEALKEERTQVNTKFLDEKYLTDEDRKVYYKKLAKYYHPDVSKEKDANEKFKKIKNAYDASDDTILFDYYDEYLELNSQEQSTGFKQSITESMVLVELINLGVYVRTQYSISKMHVDFALVKEKIVIEIDGPYHNTVEQKIRDQNRDIITKKLGWKVLRYPVNEKLTKESARKIARDIRRDIYSLINKN